MKKTATIILLTLFSNLFAQQTDYEVKAINYNELKTIVNQQDDVLYVVNFWATWCKPCIEEIPDFLKVNEAYKDEPKFKMIFISLDHKNLMNTKVRNFVRKSEMNASVYLLNDEKPVLELIPEIDSSWQGTIPSTAFYKNGKKLLFHQGSMTLFELEDLVDDFMQ